MWKVVFLLKTIIITKETLVLRLCFLSFPVCDCTAGEMILTNVFACARDFFSLAMFFFYLNLFSARHVVIFISSNSWRFSDPCHLIMDGFVIFYKDTPFILKKKGTFKFTTALWIAFLLCFVVSVFPSVSCQQKKKTIFKALFS